ncbi:MAG: hypothetical protein AB7O26_01395 [Planctomycetaceae bacterium]
MNYFAHGMRFTDRPWFLAGTALPDWLSVADRAVRLRSREVLPLAESEDPIEADLASGILQHLHDDHWFHRSRAFVEIAGSVAHHFRQTLGPEDGFRPGFLGHIATELLLDGVLIDEHPQLLEAYYDALDRLDPDRLQAAVNRMSRTPTERIAPLVPLFRREQFLRDYVDPKRLLYRLNQVMRRIKLKPLPDEIEEVLVSGWAIVKPRSRELLPETHFQFAMFR